MAGAASSRRILGRLREAGIVASQLGPRGGWSLTRPPGRVDLAQVWRAVNSSDPVLGVHLPDPDCPVGAGVHQSLQELDRRALAALLTELARTTVADVLADVMHPA